MKAVQTPGSIGSIEHETCFLEQAEMAGHGRPTDRQSISHLLHRAITIGQHLDDRAAMRISESSEGIAFEGLSGDGDHPPLAACLSRWRMVQRTLSGFQVGASVSRFQMVWGSSAMRRLTALVGIDYHPSLNRRYGAGQMAGVIM
jgi:hypothetical protein